MSAKWDVRDIAAAHYGTLTDAVTGRWRLRDYLAFIGLPLVLGAGAAYFDVRLLDVARLLAGISVFTALLFALVSNVLSLYLRVSRDEGLSHYDPLVEDVKDLFANVSYSVLVGIVLVVLLVAAGGTQRSGEPLNGAWVFSLVAVFVHLLLSVLMSLNRLWLAHMKIGQLPPKR